ncbi:lysosomal Pro-X carboxypeptidase [Morus notabilis]|uniref:lysosomal Pro-X carboxypeptidase n=1 Tax=Morus notabilis TaxID=981085 RepID=UPI000CED03BE|nr:lysosomal Pro-X carboxypeptidase [Morus notabilis]
MEPFKGRGHRSFVVDLRRIRRGISLKFWELDRERKAKKVLRCMRYHRYEEARVPHALLSSSASDVVLGGFSDSVSTSESESCYKVIKGSWKQIKDTANKPGGAKLLRKAFKLCEDYEYIADYLENWLSTAYIYTSMTDYPTPSNFLNPLPAYPIKQMCKAIDNPTTGNDTFAKLYGAANIYYNYTGTAKCFDLDDDSDPHGLSGWGWQACTEMILPTSGNTKESIFPASEWHYSGRVSYCKNVYGVEPRRNWITTEFGGFGIERVLKRFGSNIIFFNGLRDPWSGGGVLKNISRSIVAIVAKEGAHHVDLRFSTKEDPEWLKEVRKQEINIIAGWISQYYHDLAHLTS